MGLHALLAGMEKRASCPYLPPSYEQMDYRCLARFEQQAGGAYYLEALRYGQYLWERRLTARAILAVTKALHAEVSDSDEALAEWPLPYRALKWVFLQHDGTDFMGNPRISFQHQAERLRGARTEQRRWRCWAVWKLAQTALPQLPDAADGIGRYPDVATIGAQLEKHGIRGEARLWLATLEGS